MFFVFFFGLDAVLFQENFWVKFSFRLEGEVTWPAPVALKREG